jgi:hypothetical protein
MFEEDKNGNINTFRQNLQATYILRLIQIVSESGSARYKIPVKSMAIYNLEKTLKFLKNRNGNISSIAHRKHLKKLIIKSLDDI